jgi:hypothetical protein
MNKISVGETILHGYGFAAKRIFANLGLTWLAAVFYVVAVAYWLQQFCTTMLVSPHPGSELNDFALFDLFCLVVVTALGSAVIARTLTGEALETGGEIMTAYFAIAQREWILFLSLLRLYVLVIGALFAVLFAGGAIIAIVLPMVGANAHWQGITALTAMDGIAALIAFAVVATLAIRLGFFAAPVASAERSASLTRTWWLTRGNSWRLFAVFAALTLPVLLLWAGAEWALIGDQLGDALVPVLSATHNSTALYQVIANNGAAIAVAWTVLIVASNMLFAGASASAYGVVRNNAEVRQTRTVPSTQIMEPAFAGSFAGFAPRQAKEPQASDMGGGGFRQEAQETFTAVAAAPEQPPVDARVAEASAMKETAAEAEAPVAPMETSASEIPADQHAATATNQLAQETVSLPKPESANTAVHKDAPPAAETITLAQFPLTAEEADTAHPAEAIHTVIAEPITEVVSEITPPLSHGDATESSQQNVPLEAA